MQLLEDWPWWFFSHHNRHLKKEKIKAPACDVRGQQVAIPRPAMPPRMRSANPGRLVRREWYSLQRCHKVTNTLVFSGIVCMLELKSQKARRHQNYGSIDSRYCNNKTFVGSTQQRHSAAPSINASTQAQKRTQAPLPILEVRTPIALAIW